MKLIRCLSLQNTDDDKSKLLKASNKWAIYSVRELALLDELSSNIWHFRHPNSTPAFQSI